MRKPPKITVTTVGKPPLTAAAAFARLLAEKVNQRPELKVVEVKKRAEHA